MITESDEPSLSKVKLEIDVAEDPELLWGPTLQYSSSAREWPSQKLCVGVDVAVVPVSTLL